MTRTRRKTLSFAAPLRLKGIGRELPPGDYDVIIDEELIEGLSFPVYRRVTTWVMAPTPTFSTELVVVDPAELTAGVAR
jgi:hypothetical protein